jgi:prepilin-type N-terminal cleavage/methylation domain-containing protein
MISDVSPSPRVETAGDAMKDVNVFSRTERNERRKVSGFSLLELLIVITIGSILLSVGVPS